MKDEFLATLSHELRTPLNAILGWAQMLSGGAQGRSDAAGAGCDTIERNARAQAQLIEDLLDMSRIIVRQGAARRAAGRPGPRSSTRRVDTVHPAADAKKHRACRCDLDARRHGAGARRPGPPAAGDLEPAVQRHQVHAARRRACGVAAGARGDGSRDPRERHRRRHRAGVPAPRVRPLPPGRRLDHAPPRRAGAGPAIVKQLVELHGGSVPRAAAPATGKGATFTVDLPLPGHERRRRRSTPRSRRSRRTTRRRAAPCETAASGRPDVLVVDDERDSLDCSCKRLLEDRRGDRLTAATAERGARRARQPTSPT